MNSECSLCKDSYVKGYIYYKNSIGDLEAKPCSCLTARKKELARNILIKNSYIPENALQYKIEDYKGSSVLNLIEKLNKFVDKFSTIGKNKCLYIQGVNGCGKTVLSWIYGLKIIDKGFSVIYINMEKLIKYAQSVQFEQESSIMLDRLLEVDCLLLDECFDKVQLYNNTTFQLAPLITFLKERIEVKQKSTLFFSNIKIQDIEKNGFTKSIQNFIYRNTLNKSFELTEEFLALQSKFNVEELWN